MMDLPAGTITFLFTDIEGSTQLLKKLGGQCYGDLLTDQRVILRTLFEKFGGREIDTQGDSFFVSFPRARDAVSAAVEIQRALASHDWPAAVEVRVRMGLHTGEPLVAEEGYVGMDVHRAARIAQSGHGRQILLSETTISLVKGELPEGVALLDLGIYKLKDIELPERIAQLVFDAGESEFPPLKAEQVQPPFQPSGPKQSSLPTFMDDELETSRLQAPIFVAREQELKHLNNFLELALTGQSQVAFITGGPGRGKTALMTAFARQALETYPDLLVIQGQCNAYTGVGDSYAPFREVLAMLTGDVETRWAAGAISTNHARRLWEAFPSIAEVLIEQGPGLVDIFVPREPLIGRLDVAMQDAGLLVHLKQDLAESHQENTDQSGLLDQFERVIRAISATHPILLLIEDLQWADSASINLLFHLGRQLAGARILILGDYRPEEVALGREGERHPLEKVLSELKRQYGEAWISLGEENLVDGRAFVDAFLETEPNTFSVSFREALFQHTQGHPLFTVELLRDMQERKVLIQDEAGSWAETRVLNWDVLPARVEGVIEERINRLEETLKEILTVASVEGENFTAQVIARVQEVQERGLVRQLSSELDRRHRLVAEQGQRRIGPENLYLYRFRHSLFRQHLYNGLSSNERMILHADVGTVLEALYAGQEGEIAPQLAWHFSEAGNRKKAAHYLLLAGDQARWRFAQAEALRHYRLAAAYLDELGMLPEAARTLMKLGQIYHTIGQFKQSQIEYEKGFSLWGRAGGDHSSAIEVRAPHKLRMAWGYPASLDPGLAADDESNAIIKQLFSGLVELSPEGDILAAGAHAWQVDEGGRKYIFNLREDVHWSDGVPVTANDYVYAWGRDGKRVQLQDVRALNDFTLSFRLELPIHNFLYVLNLPLYYPVPRHVVERIGDDWVKPEHIVSNGPFILDSHIPGERLGLTRNPGYYGLYSGNLHQVEISLHGKSDKWSLFQDDRLDIAEVFFPEYLPIQSQQTGELLIIPSLATIWVNLNTQRLPFQDHRVRRALAMAINKEKLSFDIQKGLSTPAAGGLLPPQFPGHAPEIGLRFDPDKARQLLAVAGFPDGRNFPVIALGTHKTRAKIGEFLCQQWQENLNIMIGLETYPFSQQFRRSKEYPLFLRVFHADYMEPAAFLWDALADIKDWLNDDYLALMEEARGVMDRDKRMSLYRLAESLLINQAYVLPLCHTKNVWLIKPWVKFYKPPYTLTQLLIYLKDVILEPH